MRTDLDIGQDVVIRAAPQIADSRPRAYANEAIQKAEQPLPDSIKSLVATLDNQVVYYKDGNEWKRLPGEVKAWTIQGQSLVPLKGPIP